MNNDFLKRKTFLQLLTLFVSLVVLSPNQAYAFSLGKLLKSIVSVVVAVVVTITAPITVPVATLLGQHDSFTCDLSRLGSPIFSCPNSPSPSFGGTSAGVPPATPGLPGFTGGTAPTQLSPILQSQCLLSPTFPMCCSVLPTNIQCRATNPLTPGLPGFGTGFGAGVTPGVSPAGTPVPAVPSVPAPVAPAPVIPAAILSFTSTIPSAEQTTLSWTTQNATACTPTADDSASLWNTSSSAVNASRANGSLNVPITKTTRYTLTCNPGNVSASQTVTVPAVAQFSLINDSASPLAVTFVSNKKETSTRGHVHLNLLGGLVQRVSIGLVLPTSAREIAGLNGVTPIVRFRDRATGPQTDTMSTLAEFGAGRDLYIEFPCNSASPAQCAVAEGTYTFGIRASAPGIISPAPTPITVNVKSFIPAIKEN